MNTPNKLTVLRLALVPVFVALLYWNTLPFNEFWALIVFAAACITDALDGHIARERNLITTFGKFMDPIADKVLVLSALICFVKFNLCSAVAVILIIAREFMVTSVRLAALDGGGKVIAASIWGKIKTVVTMIAILLILLMQSLTELQLIPAGITAIAGQILIWLATVVTVISGMEYVIKNREFIDTTK